MGNAEGLPAQCSSGHVADDVDCDVLCCTGAIFTGNPCPGFLLGGPCNRAFETASAADSDGDGLSDDAETCGLDTNSDGSYDLNLSALGANPNHKDIFLELDTMPGQAPTQAGIRQLKQAFAAAPVSVGGVANPDGLPGINLWVDTGTQSDPTAAEDGGFPGSCGDGVDNGGDGLVDGNDPDCFIGDNLGGGNQLPTSSICDVNIAAFVTAKNANFAANRWPAFHYAISAVGCDVDLDGNIDSGGWGESGGNDFIEYNHDPGTIMHELGHNLNLLHGGNVNDNCKPNYVSVMNYDHQFGIPQAGGGSIIDFSPPRFAGGRGAAPLGNLVENDLDDNAVLDGTDATNRFIFTDPAGRKVQAPLNLGVNWNSDTDPPFESNQAINVDTANTAGNPAACANTATNSTLTGHDDWSNMRLDFRSFADSADGVFNPPLSEPEPNLASLLALQVELRTTDLEVSGSATPSPVPAGTSLGYAFLVRNNGPNPAAGTTFRVQLPSGASLLASPPGCAPGLPGELVCPLGELLSKQERVLEFTVGVAADFVYNSGTALVTTARVSHSAGPDSSTTNNEVTVTTPVVGVSDFGLSGLAATSPPAEVLIGTAVPVTFHATATNGGPSSPADALVQSTLVAPPGAHVAVPPADVAVTALAVGAPRSVNISAQLVCDAPGPHVFTLSSHIVPARPGESDPVSANNTAVTTITVECVVPVAIDIMPGASPNRVSLNSTKLVAILTTAAGEYGKPLAFDASTVDPRSVRFGTEAEVWAETGGAADGSGGRLQDVNELGGYKDGDADLVLQFKVRDSGLAASATRACVKGEFFGSGGVRYSFFGCDAIHVVP
jgi:hypothetical protein